MITHAKISTIPDDDDTTQIRPSDWNEPHTVTGIFKTSVTIFANTASRVISHDLGAIPDIYHVVPLQVGGVMWFVTNETDTQFTLNLAAPQDEDIQFKVAAVIL